MFVVCSHTKHIAVELTEVFEDTFYCSSRVECNTLTPVQFRTLDSNLLPNGAGTNHCTGACQSTYRLRAIQVCIRLSRKHIVMQSKRCYAVLLPFMQMQLTED